MQKKYLLISGILLVTGFLSVIKFAGIQNQESVSVALLKSKLEQINKEEMRVQNQAINKVCATHYNNF